MVSEAEFVQFVLGNIRGAGFVTIQTQTAPALSKEGKAVLGQVTKTARVNGVINWQYAKSVNRQRKREGKTVYFEAHARKWGTRLKGLPFVVHVTKPRRKADKPEHRLYLEMKVEKSLGHEYSDASGNPLDAETVKPFLRNNGKSRQGVDKEIILRDYHVQNITGMKINGIEV